MSEIIGMQNNITPHYRNVMHNVMHGKEAQENFTTKKINEHLYSSGRTDLTRPGTVMTIYDKQRGTGFTCTP